MHEDGGCSMTDIERAQRLQRALSAALALPSETPIAERARYAAPHYVREFGPVTERHLRRVITEVIERDGGQRSFARPDLYATPTNSAPRLLLAAEQFEVLHEL